jgi:hypothetical protein
VEADHLGIAHAGPDPLLIPGHVVFLSGNIDLHTVGRWGYHLEDGLPGFLVDRRIGCQEDVR